MVTKPGVELGWFEIFTVEKDMECTILIISMVEDAKERGGSGYLAVDCKNQIDMTN